MRKTKRCPHRVSTSIDGTEIHVNVVHTKPKAKPTKRVKGHQQIDSYMAAFAAQTKQEQIQSHREKMLLAFESIETKRPTSIRPISRSIPKFQFTQFEPDPPRVPKFDLSEFMKYMHTGQTQTQSVPKPTRASSPPPVKKLQQLKIDRPRSASKATQKATLQALPRQRPQTAKSRNLSKTATMEVELERLLIKYQAQFQSHIPRAFNSLVQPRAKPFPLNDDGRLPAYHLDFHNSMLGDMGIPGFHVTFVNAISLAAFEPHIVLSIDVSATSLTDTGCYTIASQLIHEPSIVSLDISSNLRVSLLGVQALLEAIKCRALYHAVNPNLPEVTALLIEDIPSVQISQVANLVDAADLTLTLSDETRVVSVATEQLAIELQHEMQPRSPKALKKQSTTQQTKPTSNKSSARGASQRGKSRKMTPQASPSTTLDSTLSDAMTTLDEETSRLRLDSNDESAGHATENFPLTNDSAFDFQREDANRDSVKHPIDRHDLVESLARTFSALVIETTLRRFVQT
ncbi:hypothetical protein LEN26_012455 [Aphanomyces euteiches]|nr:hypothetical protein AeMF1_011852 [Aphanomyces euteiches]KAH9117777.1 hypothetical protein LEN26_012455 [Aphanomyces euteiches]KAH9188791.1 hypothetical protein AeNC1_009230 [Aphanomyces euteiches]